MGPFVVPVFAFLLWEFPSMVVMSLHKAFCAMRGGSFEEQFLGVWVYRLIGMFTVYPAVAIVAALANAISPGLLPVTLFGEALVLIGLLIWARTSSAGS
ncbi:hypothetical protein KOI35_21580 [Actinoplanes bogorensis]|uniref:Uncharacterized protein n=1 Tax=Paractinoplanes bogorensis TaxID=1610840 RepID=A0ABS5YRN5_9ACTN|nr:hypothetical protein [Actinoplanes bogorensis]MBU2666110.1 hypothetical protein [Actinoplanes bogorensis]